ncbi:MAG: hypothetical protein Q9227_004970 [Pyrenula ochraceoflavens]
MASVRICVCGDEGSGKSSLIASLVKDTFVSNKIQPVLPQVTIPPTIGTPENVTTTVVDTSALPQERPSLAREIRKSNVILLLYSDHYSYERVALFWLPHFRSLGVNVPVVLCANKADLTKNVASAHVTEEEMLPVMAEFKEIDACIRTSAREHYNVNEAFFLCQKSVTHPIAPLFDSKESVLKPAAIAALQRVFYLCDKDQDNYLSDKELDAFQLKCFNKPLNEEDRDHIKATIRQAVPDAVTHRGISSAGFLYLNKLYAEKGRHETIWTILRTFQYTSSLSLQESFLHPKFPIPSFSSAELSPAGYRFFVDLFLTSDKDNSGALSPVELSSLFAPTPGIPPQWLDDDFPSSVVRNESGHVTLQGWLAQWSMTTFTSPRTTLEYLAYLGFESPSGTTAALKVTKPRKRRGPKSRHTTPPTARTVLLAVVVGAPGSGKSALLSALLSRPFNNTYHPTISPRVACNTVELPGGRQCYLILSEPGTPSVPAYLDNAPKLLETCDVIVYTYDSSDPDSFAYIPTLRSTHPHLEDLPSVYLALKADLDRSTQRAQVQPDDYTAAVQRMPQGPPLHTSATWESIQEALVAIAQAALQPASAFPKIDEEEKSYDRMMNLGMALGAVVCVGATAAVIWKRSLGKETSSRPRDRDYGYGRRGHAPQLSISDDNHHVTEAIGYMYEDNDNYDGRRESRPLSYASSPLSNSIENNPHRHGELHHSPRSPPAQVAPVRKMSSDQNYRGGSGTIQPQSPPSRQWEHVNGQSPPTMARNNSWDREENSSRNARPRAPSETATSSFPLNDIDYESSPAAVAQELSNLQALRRMSMDVAATGDPDLPALSPSGSTSPASGDEDASRLFWVPARVHPELAPKEFKAFLENKAEQIKRKSGEFSPVDEPVSQRSGSLSVGGTGLRRKKSMLSRQIDNSDGAGADGYEDGAEILERKRSMSGRPQRKNPNLRELEQLVTDPQKLQRMSLESAQQQQSPVVESPGGDDVPIVPAAPGASLRRSTRTTYRRGSTQKKPSGDRATFARRMARAAEFQQPSPIAESPVHHEGDAAPTTTGSEDSGALQLTDEPPRLPPITTNFSRPGRSQSSSSAFSADMPNFDQPQPAPRPEPEVKPEQPQPTNIQVKRWESRISSGGRSSLVIPPENQTVPHIVVQTPQQPQQSQPRPPSPQRSPPPPTQQQSFSSEKASGQASYRQHPERTSSHVPPRSTSPPQRPQPVKQTQHRPGPVRNEPQPRSKSPQTLDQMSAKPSPLPGHHSTNDLSFVPMLTEDKKADSRLTKPRKEEPRKSSWGWLLGKEEQQEKERQQKEEAARKPKARITKPPEKHENTRLDVLQSSIDGGNRGRESLVLDRENVRLEEERKKESARKSAGSDTKKEKDSLFSSIFGGGKKKGDRESGKKYANRALSPEPPPRILKPDIDYNWTRFSILEERAIYRMAHIKLANPRRALYSQVLLSNFMYSYLAKVQQMHPQMNLPTSAKQQQKKKEQPEEFANYQRYQEQQQYVQQKMSASPAQHSSSAPSHGSGAYGPGHGGDSNGDSYGYDQRDAHRPSSRGSKHNLENGAYSSGGYHREYNDQHGDAFGDSIQGDDDDDMW